MEKSSEKKDRNSNKVRFVKLKRKLEELIPYQNLKLESIKRWQRVDDIVHKIENAEDYRDYKKIAENISSLDDEEMRVRVITQSELNNEISANKELSKWGKYLRAPDIYFEIIEKCSDKLFHLEMLLMLDLGLKQG